MPHRYDASTKYLLDVRLADWLPLCGRSTTARLRIINADVSTVTAAADRVLLVEEIQPWILHVELQSGRDMLLADRTQMYNTLIGWRHGLPVRSLIVLLRPAADEPELSGVLERRFPDEPPYLVFRYQTVRLWQLPLERLLQGGLGLVPLAPLSSVAESELPTIIRRMRQRIDREASPEEAATLWTAADVLMGLRYPREFITGLLRGITNMKESVTYQAIVEEGRMEATRQMLLDLGAERFGQPTADVEEVINQTADEDQLRRLVRRLLHVASWQELLAAI